MLEEYKVYLENLRIPTFTQLVEAARRTSLSVRRPKQETRAPKGIPLVAATSEAKGGNRGGGSREGGNRGGAEYQGKMPREMQPPPPFPCTMDKVLKILEDCVKDGVVILPEVGSEPTTEDKATPNYCKFHRCRRHPTVECWTLRRKFDEKLKTGLIILDNVQNVNDQPYPNHGGYPNQGGNQRPMINVLTEDRSLAHRSEALPQEIFECHEEPDHMHDSLTERLLRHRSFKCLFDKMGFTTAARHSAMTALIRVSEKYAEECFIAPSVMYLQPALSFSESDRVIPGPHNFPLYVDAVINGVTMPRALVDGGSALNVMPYGIFTYLNIPEEEIVQ